MEHVVRKYINRGYIESLQIKRQEDSWDDSFVFCESNAAYDAQLS